MNTGTRFYHFVYYFAYYSIVTGNCQDGPQVKATVICNDVYGPAVVHAAYLDPWISKAEISGSFNLSKNFC